MKNILMRLPLSAGGIALTFASLGNLLNNLIGNMFSQPALGSFLHSLFGWLALITLVIVILRFLAGLRMMKMVFTNAVMVGMLCTVPMTLGILAGYLPASYGVVLWWSGVSIHLLLMIWFSWEFIIRHFSLESILPPWYIVFVGFAISGLNSRSFAPAWYGHAVFWFGLVCFLLLFALIWMRIKRYGLSIMDRPMLCINAAIGICLTTYVENYASPQLSIIALLDAFGLVIWFWLVLHLWRWLKDPFYPSDAAFSFPFTVAAIGSMEAAKGLKKIGIMIMSWNTPLVTVQTIVAVIMLCITIYKFSKHVLDPNYNEMKMAMAGSRGKMS